MSRLTVRQQWRKALASAAFPASLRPVKATLLVLVELMSPAGELRAWREEMIQATGLPSRTLDRHLQRAVEDGWLVREMPAGKRRMAVYLATIPADPSSSSVRHLRRAEGEFCAPPTRVQNSSSVRHPVANSIRQSTRVSEFQAVDDQRGRRSDRDGSSAACGEHDARSQAGTDRSGLPTPLRRSSSDSTGDVA